MMAIIINAIIVVLGVGLRQFNQGSQSKENPIKMEKAGIWQTFLAPFQLSVQLNFSGTHVGLFILAFLLQNCPWILACLHCI